MTEEGRYAAQVTIVKQECPDADEKEIAEEFRRYEEEFLIPPEDALRSVVRKFQAATGRKWTSSQTSTPMIAMSLSRLR